MLENWPVLSESERKSVKETFSEGLHDNKPEVQLLAVDGMVAYLAMQVKLTPPPPHFFWWLRPGAAGMACLIAAVFL